jgi:sulfatase modifying factor 1
MPASYSSDLGETWHWEMSAFPVMSNLQRPAIARLKDGAIVLCSFTDQWRPPFKEHQGRIFLATTGNYTGYSLYADGSQDEGKTWPDRRLLATKSKANADGYGDLGRAPRN